MGGPHISLAAEKIGFGITNSLLMTWLVVALLIGLCFLPPAKLILEIMIEKLEELFRGVVGDHHLEMFFPLLATIFIFILVLNWSGLLPGVGTVGIYLHDEFVPLLRAGTADLNLTLAIALISVLSIQYFGIKSLGRKYFERFKNPLEIISEFSKIISFTFRLFGNIFAGEVLLAVIAFLLPFIAPLPFLGMELFVGFIQALVFSMLTAVFLNMAVVAHEH